MAEKSPVTVRIDGDIAHVQVDNPPVNATSASVRAGLERAVTEVSAAGARVAILSCAGKTFIAGGDISEVRRRNPSRAIRSSLSWKSAE